MNTWTVQKFSDNIVELHVQRGNYAQNAVGFDPDDVDNIIDVLNKYRCERAASTLVSEYRECVTNGAVWMDLSVPNWRAMIGLDFDMRLPLRCVLGQTLGYQEVSNTLEESAMVSLGFKIAEHTQNAVEHYAALTQAWREVI